MGVTRTGRVFSTLAGLAALALSTPSQAQEVVLTPAADGLVVDYRLDRPEARFVFADPGVARGDWSARGEGVALADGAVSAGAPVDRFSLLIRPDSTEDGRGYIALTRVGEGYVLYGPALTGEGRTLSLTARAQGWVLTPADAGRGYVYFGPAAALRRLPSGAAAIAAPDLPAPLRETVFGAFDDAVGFYSTRFGPPPRPPALSVTVQGAGPMAFRGDVTDTELISARFHGDRWANPDVDDLAGVAAFAFHETAHLWNSHFARPAEGSPWLHEGGAEYMALVGATTRGRLTEAEARDGLSARLTGCRRALGTRSPAAQRMVSGSSVYDCGVLIQWLADMELRRMSSAPRSVFDIWKGLIDRAASGTPEYGPADFRAGLVPDSAVAVLLDGPGESRWAAIEERLTGLGVRWENRPSPQNYLVAALSHLNREACAAGASTGFYLREGYVQLANAETCGPLSGEVPLATVEDLDPLEQSRAMFEAVQTRCAAGEMVRLTRRDDGTALTVPCTKPLAAPIAYAITEAPTLAFPEG